MRYVATFPLLLNVADQPTYFMALKGEDGLVKMYAMVNVQQYSIVSTGGTVAACETSYRQALADNGLISGAQTEVTPSDQAEVTGPIAEIRTAVMDGNSYYFLRLEDDTTFYAVSAADSPLAVILNVGDPVTITYAAGSSGSILSGTQVRRADQPDEEITLTLPAEEETAVPEGEATEAALDQTAENAA